MQIGAVYPQTELRGDPIAVRRIGTAVEELGFDHLLAYDHVLGAVHADRTPRLTGPYTERLRERVHGLGRSVEDFGAEYVVRPQGGRSDLTGEIDAWRQAGGTHLSVVTMGLGLGSVDGHIDYLSSVAKALNL